VFWRIHVRERDNWGTWAYDSLSLIYERIILTWSILERKWIFTLDSMRLCVHGDKVYALIMTFNVLYLLYNALHLSLFRVIPSTCSYHIPYISCVFPLWLLRFRSPAFSLWWPLSYFVNLCHPIISVHPCYHNIAFYVVCRVPSFRSHLPLSFN
jgi:hypothetical protein